MDAMSTREEFDRLNTIAELQRSFDAISKSVVGAERRELALEKRNRELEFLLADAVERNKLFTTEIGGLKSIIEEMRKSWKQLNDRLKALEK